MVTFNPLLVGIHLEAIQNVPNLVVLAMKIHGHLW